MPPSEGEDGCSSQPIGTSSLTISFYNRGVAQPGRALVLGTRGRDFDIPHPDHSLCLKSGLPVVQNGNELEWMRLSADGKS